MPTDASSSPTEPLAARVSSSSGVHPVVSPLARERRRNLRSLRDARRVGDVDVSNGRVVFEEVDLSAGQSPVCLRRTYSSAWADRESTFGRGWSHAWERRLTLERGEMVYRDGEGRELVFQSPAVGETAAHATEDVQLHRVDLGWTAVREADGTVAWLYGGRLIKVVVAETEVHVSYDDAGRVSRVADARACLDLEYRNERVTRAILRAEGAKPRVARYEYHEGTLARVRTADRAQRYVGCPILRRDERDGTTVYYGYDGTTAAARCQRRWVTGSELDGGGREYSYARAHTSVFDGVAQRVYPLAEAVAR